MHKPQNSPSFYSRAAASILLGVSIRTLDRWRTAGLIEAVRSPVTGRVRLSRESVYSALEAMRRGEL